MHANKNKVCGINRRISFNSGDLERREAAPESIGATLKVGKVVLLNPGC